MNARPIEFHPEAVAEAAEARQWYAGIDPALGEAFAGELDRAVERMTAAPERWARHLHGTRVFPHHRFPYLVVYRLVASWVQVVAVQHAKRRPVYWRSRTGSSTAQYGTSPKLTSCHCGFRRVGRPVSSTGRVA